MESPCRFYPTAFELTCLDESFLKQPAQKRRRPQEYDGIKIIKIKHLELIRQIGRGPGYLLHAGKNKDRAVIVKVFDQGPTVRQELESTAALSKALMHPNVLRMKGISQPHSPSHFIVYENGHCTNAEVLLAAALKNDLAKSITLGFTMVAEVSAGISHLCMQGVWPTSMGVASIPAISFQLSLTHLTHKRSRLPHLISLKTTL
ncbi:hypothetical protein K438DRAFT_342032 [Mycena galopus ATCC 62051]|nr:hypothetical protein K438DRAFT_342032 [Mycena galopus ATCC 62051]